MAKLTAAQRNALSDSAFAGPHRSYPINDPNHARAALSRVSQFGSSTERAKVRAKVNKRYPKITKRKPGEVSDVRSQNPGTRGVEGARPYPSKAGYQIPTANESTGSPYKRHKAIANYMKRHG